MVLSTFSPIFFATCFTAVGLSPDMSFIDIPLSVIDATDFSTPIFNGSVKTNRPRYVIPASFDLVILG